MCRSIQTELLQDWFQLPLDEVVGMQATTFPTQEKWLLGVPVLNVKPKTFCKLRRESEESLLAVLRPLQFAFPPTSLNRDCLLVQVDISDVQATDFSAPDAGLRYQPEDGKIWLGTVGGLNKWDGGQIKVFGGHSAEREPGSGKPDGKIDGNVWYPLFQDSRGRIWIMTRREFGYVENNQLTTARAIPSWVVLSIAEDNSGNLWIANQELGLFRLSPQNDTQQIPWAALGHKDHASVLAADPLHGGLWRGFFQGGVAYFSDGGIRAAYGPANGLGEGMINSLRLDEDGTLWAATNGGLSRFKNGHFATLTSKNGLPCDTVHWSMEDNDRSFWLYMPCGLICIARSELDKWIALADKDKDKDVTRRVISTVFDSSDGVRAVAKAGTLGPQVAKSADGKLWFTSHDGAACRSAPHSVQQTSAAGPH